MAVLPLAEPWGGRGRALCGLLWEATPGAKHGTGVRLRAHEHSHHASTWQRVKWEVHWGSQDRVQASALPGTRESKAGHLTADSQEH